MKNVIKYEGELNLADGAPVIPCYVLEDGTRVLSGRAMQNALQISPLFDKSEELKAGGDLARFLSSKWFNSLIPSGKNREHFAPIVCYKGRQKINGYEATILVDFCNIMLEARKNKVIITERQRIIAEQSEILIRAFANVGIIALVDEATGYHHEREHDGLQKILKVYISAELLPWQKTFPDISTRRYLDLMDGIIQPTM